MSISKEEMLHIADLACLNLDEKEIDKYTRDMQEIINLANEVNNIDTDDVDDTNISNLKTNAFRKDEIINFENREILLQNAPSQEDGMFKIPKMSL